MSNQLWSSWGASVIGPLHVKTGLPNQDFWMARRYKWGNVVVVSDGLGSKVHSDHGARAACLAVFDAARSYRHNPDAHIVDVLRLIHANWLIKIAPFSPSDCAATCLFVIEDKDMITLGSLGDGMIAALGKTKDHHLIISDNKQGSFSNYTRCLQAEFHPDHWQISKIESMAYHGVVLCSDGISDDLLAERQMPFVQELYSTYADMTPAVRTRDLKRWLTEWPVPGHSDDKTIACLFKK